MSRTREYIKSVLSAIPLPARQFSFVCSYAECVSVVRIGLASLGWSLGLGKGDGDEEDNLGLRPV